MFGDPIEHGKFRMARFLSGSLSNSKPISYDKLKESLKTHYNIEWYPEGYGKFCGHFEADYRVLMNKYVDHFGKDILILLGDHFRVDLTMLYKVGQDIISTQNNFLNQKKQTPMSKLDQMIAENYFTKNKKKSITEVVLDKKKRLSIISKEIAERQTEQNNIQRFLDDIGNAYEAGDVDLVESLLSEVS